MSSPATVVAEALVYGDGLGREVNKKIASFFTLLISVLFMKEKSTSVKAHGTGFPFRQFHYNYDL